MPKLKKKEIKINDNIVCPSNGIGVVQAIEMQTYYDVEIEFLKVFFENSLLTLYIVVSELENMGIRHVMSKAEAESALEALKYPTKSNETWAKKMDLMKNQVLSGIPICIARTCASLHPKKDSVKSPSYTEKKIYDMAIERFSSEIAKVFGTTQEEAKLRIITEIESAKPSVKIKTEDENKEDEDDFEDLDLDIYDEESESSSEEKQNIA